MKAKNGINRMRTLRAIFIDLKYCLPSSFLSLCPFLIKFEEMLKNIPLGTHVQVDGQES